MHTPSSSQLCVQHEEIVSEELTLWRTVHFGSVPATNGFREGLCIVRIPREFCRPPVEQTCSRIKLH